MHVHSAFALRQVRLSLSGQVLHGSLSKVHNSDKCPRTARRITCRMDEVLVLMSRAARRPVPVRTAATSALGEFRKTHETTESQPLKERLKPQVWDSIMDVTLQSSYFA